MTRRLIGSGVTDSNGNVGVEYTGTGAGKFWTNYHMFGVHTVQWNRGTTTISDLKIKQIWEKIGGIFFYDWKIKLQWIWKNDG